MGGSLSRQDTSFCIGEPRFRDPRLARISLEKGAVAAWHRAFEDAGPRAAAAAVDGSFAVALHLEDGRAFLAVDRFAVQTLCWRLNKDRLETAPRADAWVGYEGAPLLDPQALFDYLYLHAIAAPRTVFAAVQRLPAAHYALFEQGRVVVERYWRPAFVPDVHVSFAEAKDEFRTLLRDAVAAELGVGKPACFLSGGTDSSTIAGVIGLAADRPAATYSIGFDAQGYDEMAYARIAARHFRTEHHEYYVTPGDVVASMPEVAAHFDQPFGNSSALPAYYCARVAREDGVTKLLAGDGGDELFGGNARYAKQRVFGWYESVPSPLRRKLIEPALLGTPLRRLPAFKKGASYVEQASTPMPERLQMYNLLLRLGIDEVFEPSFLAQVDRSSPMQQQRRVWDEATADHPIDRTLAFDWRFTLAESDLPKVRGAAEMAGLAVGFPFLEQRLVDFSMRLPPHYKLRGLKLRWFFKEAVRGFLPDEIIVKKKKGFGLPFGVWLMRHQALHALAGDAVRSLGTRGILRPGFVEELLKHRLPVHPGYYGEMVWLLAMLELWLRRHVPALRVLS